MLRPATPDDLDIILELERETFPETAFSRATFLYYIDSDSSSVRVLEDDGILAGYVVYSVRQQAAAVYVDSIAVRPDYRRQGLGRRMMAEVREAAAARNAQFVQLHVRESNCCAIHFYRALGFERAGRAPYYYRDGEDACIMRLDLSD